MASKIRWGILGCGSIANKFAEALSFVDDAQLVAVGSRSAEKAKEFGDKYKAPRHYGSYQELADDKDVDIVYVATPHNFHCENTIMCLEAGKAVLCEKAFAANAQQAKAMIDCARKKKLFLMEAMWTRFLPIMVKVRQLLAEEAIGDVRMLDADFCFRCDDGSEKTRLLAPELAGGALLDVGVYLISLSSMIFGTPDRIHSDAYLGKTGVDEQAAIILSFDKGRLATMCAAVRTLSPQEATIMGTKGMIRLHSSWWNGNKLTLIRPDKEDQFIELASHSNGFVYEIEAAHQALRKGLLETDIMPLDESLAIMQTIDVIRKQCGLKYPFE